MSTRRQFGFIENTWEHIGTPGNSQERTGAQGKDFIMTEKGHNVCPINAPMSTHLPSAAVVADVIFFVLLLMRLFE